MSQISLQNICVFIEDEKQLQEARELLERFGEKTHASTFRLTSEWLNYLKRNKEEWYLGMHLSIERQITLTELEKLLEDEKPNP